MSLCPNQQIFKLFNSNICVLYADKYLTFILFVKQQKDKTNFLNQVDEK